MTIKPVTKAARRVAIYARYSTDLQNDRSIEDQVALCREFAMRQGWAIADVFADRAVSGASVIGRHEYERMLGAAMSGRLDIVLAEDLDRLSRNQADIASLFERLAFASVAIHTVADGLINEMHIGLKGTMSAMFLKTLALKVRRGMAGVARSGRNAGGRAYGYKPKAGEPGVLEIIEEEASVVRRIFNEYVAGVSPRAIAANLNRDGIAPPRGSHWNASTINGNAKRGNGILLNPIYAGRSVWNRVTMVKNPATGRRVSRINDQNAWVCSDAAHLRIVDASLFESAQARKATAGGLHARRAPRSKRLLSGLLRCGACGGGMTILGRDRSGPRVQCSRHKESGACKNGARYYIEKVERIVVNALRAQLADPALAAQYIAAYVEERRALASKIRRERAKIEAAHAAKLRSLALLIDAVADGTLTKEEAAPRLQKDREERDRLAGQLSMGEDETNVVDLHPTAVSRFRENMEQIASILATPNGEVAASIATPFRQLIHSVIVMPRKAGEEYVVELKAHVSALLGADVWPAAPKLSAIGMVAEDGFEPPTHGL